MGGYCSSPTVNLTSTTVTQSCTALNSSNYTSGSSWHRSSRKYKFRWYRCTALPSGRIGTSLRRFPPPRGNGASQALLPSAPGAPSRRDPDPSSRAPAGSSLRWRSPYRAPPEATMGAGAHAALPRPPQAPPAAPYRRRGNRCPTARAVPGARHRPARMRAASGRRRAPLRGGESGENRAGAGGGACAREGVWRSR